MSSKGKAPKTYLDKVVAAILALREHEGSSRAAIRKYIKDAYSADNATAFKKALQSGMKNKRLQQGATKQRFRVSGVEFEKADDGFKIKNIREGEGEAATSGSSIVVSYKGYLKDGSVFDRSSRFQFDLGAGDVIKGWDRGVVGMKVGGKRRIICPPKYAYGKRGSPPEIPPNATLTFSVKLLEILQ